MKGIEVGRAPEKFFDPRRHARGSVRRLNKRETPAATSKS